MTSPVDTVRDFYAVLAKGDVPGVVALLHPTLEWTEAQGFPYYSGTWRTPQEVVEKLLCRGQQDDGQGNALTVCACLARRRRPPRTLQYVHRHVVGPNGDGSLRYASLP